MKKSIFKTIIICYFILLVLSCVLSELYFLPMGISLAIIQVMAILLLLLPLVLLALLIKTIADIKKGKKRIILLIVILICFICSTLVNIYVITDLFRPSIGITHCASATNCVDNGDGTRTCHYYTDEGILSEDTIICTIAKDE